MTQYAHNVTYFTDNAPVYSSFSCRILESGCEIFSETPSQSFNRLFCSSDSLTNVDFKSYLVCRERLAISNGRRA